MAATITISVKDESFSGGIINEVLVGFDREQVTIRDIIEARVRQEVEAYNNRMPEYFDGLVEPTDAEKTLNGVKLRSKKPIDAEKQIYIALNAFQKNGFFVLIENVQSTSLDQPVTLTDQTRISFLKLTPLVGG